MKLSLHTLTTPEACDKALIAFNYKRKNYIYQQLGLELRQERLLHKMAGLNHKSLRAQAELEVLDLLLPQLPEGKHKAKQELKQVKWEFAAWKLSQDKKKLNAAAILALECEDRQMQARIKVAEQAIAQVTERKMQLMNEVPLTLEENSPALAQKSIKLRPPVLSLRPVLDAQTSAVRPAQIVMLKMMLVLMLMVTSVRLTGIKLATSQVHPSVFYPYIVRGDSQTTALGQSGAPGALALPYPLASPPLASLSGKHFAKSKPSSRAENTRHVLKNALPVRFSSSFT